MTENVATESAQTKNGKKNWNMMELFLTDG